MHFCPHPNCRCWYHRQCLLQQHLVADVWDRGVQILLPHYQHNETRGSIKGKRKRVDDAQILRDCLATLPQGVAKVAQLPIVKGLQAGGIVGNIASVMAARKMLFCSLFEGSVVSGDWKEKIDVSGSIKAARNAPLLVCHRCKACI